MNSPEARRKRTVYFYLLGSLSLILALAATLAPLLSEALTSPLQEGQVAMQDYRATEATAYVSEIRTELRRRAAEQLVAPIYTSPDTRVARTQMEKLRAALAYIQSVRADVYATPEQKRRDLANLEEVSLRSSTIEAILAMSDARWQAVQQEALAVLERVMSASIRPEDLEEVRGRLPALVSLAFPEDQAQVIAELTSPFVAANSFYSDELTRAAREQARQQVEPVIRTFVPGQTIVSQGEVLDAEDIEALRQLGLLTPRRSWKDLAGAAGITLLLFVYSALYLRRKPALLGNEVRRVAVVALLMVLFLLGARLSIPTHTVIPFAFPFMAFGLTLAALFGVEVAIVLSLPLAVLTAYALPNGLELTLYYVFGTIFSILALGRARRLLNFLWAGLSGGAAGSVVILVYHLPLPTTDAIGLATLTAASFFSGLASASIAILLHSALANFLGMVVPLQLLDLMRPEHPLLRLLMREAPGTYQHSLQVANLAEQAAERIGADALLTRVGALYHDVGKTANPAFFIENQPQGIANPHEELTPEESAAIIIQHVRHGLELGRKYRLPQRVLDFISEHHGTCLARYQYYRAVRAAGGDERLVDRERFRYPGPRPRSRETAILMLADGCEARVRAERPADDEQLLAVIKNVIAERLAAGELDDTRLTMHDLNQIAESFAATLRGFYHPRLRYPTIEPAPEPLTTPIARTAGAEVGESR